MKHALHSLHVWQHRLAAVLALPPDGTAPEVCYASQLLAAAAPLLSLNNRWASVSVTRQAAALVERVLQLLASQQGSRGSERGVTDEQLLALAQPLLRLAVAAPSSTDPQMCGILVQLQGKVSGQRGGSACPACGLGQGPGCCCCCSLITHDEGGRLGSGRGSASNTATPPCRPPPPPGPGPDAGAAAVAGTSSC
jgi:hypothetical protein